MLTDDSITASTQTLFSQASDAAESYMNRAVSSIDSRFGDGFAKKNPELIAAFMKTCASDFAASINGRSLEKVASRIESLAMPLNRIADNVGE